MKRVSVFSLIFVLSMPVLAEEMPVVTEGVAETLVEGHDITGVATEVTDAIVEQKKSSFLRGFQIGVGVSGTSGLNGFVGFVNKDFDSFWAKRFGVRFDFGTTSPIESQMRDVLKDIVGDGIDIGDELTISDIDIDAHHYAALVDFYPFGNTWFLGGWRVTGGYYFGELSATAHIAGTINELDGGSYEFELGGHNFKYTGNSVHGTAEFDWDYRGPYLGTGFDFGLFAGFKIYMDTGIVFTNKAAQLNLEVPVENLYMDGAFVNSSELEDAVKDVVDEVSADVQSELDDFKFYPIVKVGFMYRF